MSLVNIAETCPYLSISGTAFYAMGLVACTTSGSESLATRGWVTIRHVRGDTWHVARDWLQQVRSCHKTAQNRLPIQWWNQRYLIKTRNANLILCVFIIFAQDWLKKTIQTSYPMINDGP